MKWYLLIILLLVGCNTSATTTTADTVALPTQAGHAASSTAAPPGVAAVEATSATPTAEPTIAATATPSPTASPTPTATTAPATPTSLPAPPPPAYSYPIGRPGQLPGDGFFIRHGVEVENTWYNPGYWHTGEDWYAVEGDTAGAHVYAIAGGDVVYAGSNYPGRVVIVRHADDLYSMYGHLDPALNVQVDQRIERGELIGTVLRRGDRTPNHLHFEIRTFLTAREVNGNAPRYGFRCGVNCPPGPGYWPIDAPDLPSDLGWRNPTHTIARRMFPGQPGGRLGEVAVVTQPVSQTVALWSAPPGDGARESRGELALRPGQRFPLLEVHAGPEAPRETSALSYQLWYRIELPDARTGWVQAAVPSTFETGGDGRPSSVYFNFVPVGETAP